jgi:hypothetical protein
LSDRNLTEHYLSFSLNQLRRVPAADDPITHCFLALDTIGRLWEHQGPWRQEHSDLIARLFDSIQDATPRLMEAVSKWMAPDEAAFLMAVTAAFVAEPESHLRYDQQLHVGLLRSQLGAIVCRREIAARGNLMLWSFQMRRALVADPSNHVVQ